jgi:hypothetical protein
MPLTLDIAVMSANAVVALDLKTGKVSTLIQNIEAPDSVAVGRQGNVFVAYDQGVLELNTNNQQLVFGASASGAGWDDVAPLSGSGAANY